MKWALVIFGTIVLAFILLQVFHLNKNIIALIIPGFIILILLTGVVAWLLQRMKGSIELAPEQYQYTVGDIIRGKLLLHLKKPTQASDLIVGLKCEKTERRYSSRGIGTTTFPLFNFSQPLEKLKDYTPSDYTYNFSIKILRMSRWIQMPCKYHALQVCL